MTINQTCCCGAKFECDSTYPDRVGLESQRFLQFHAQCLTNVSKPVIRRTAKEAVEASKADECVRAITVLSEWLTQNGVPAAEVEDITNIPKVVTEVWRKAIDKATNQLDEKWETAVHQIEAVLATRIPAIHPDLGKIDKLAGMVHGLLVELEAKAGGWRVPSRGDWVQVIKPISEEYAPVYPEQPEVRNGTVLQVNGIIGFLPKGECSGGLFDSVTIPGVNLKWPGNKSPKDVALLPLECVIPAEPPDTKEAA